MPTILLPYCPSPRRVFQNFLRPSTTTFCNKVHPVGCKTSCSVLDRVCQAKEKNAYIDAFPTSK